jgi:hypothetical protein
MLTAARRASATIVRALIAIGMASASAGPVNAAFPATRPAPAGTTFSSLLLEVQSIDRGDSGKSNDTGRDRNDRPDRPIRNDRIDTERTVQDLLSVKRECSRYDDVYRIDCLRQGIEQTILKMPDRPENREARAILKRTSEQLRTIVATYEDEYAALLEVPATVNPRFKQRRTYRAVKRADLSTAMAKADAVVTEATTQLLRASENSVRRYAHYQQIAAAVDSTKTLLRSG